MSLKERMRIQTIRENCTVYILTCKPSDAYAVCLLDEDGGDENGDEDDLTLAYHHGDLVHVVDTSFKYILVVLRFPCLKYPFGNKILIFEINF